MAGERVTVVTATFNRASTLPRVYASLEAQTIDCFAWLVVDDGSTDDTRALVSGWQGAARFPIEYVHQNNKGKHAALNRGLASVDTELCGVLDSDDWYLPDGLERLLRQWDAIPEAERGGFANVEGRAQLADGTLVGPPSPAAVADLDYYEATVERGWRFDTRGLWRADVMREYPFPEDLGRFVSEAIVFHRVATKYRTRYCSDVVGGTEYRAGGLSDRSGDTGVIVDARRFHLAYARELLGYRRRMPPGLRIRTHANESRHALHCGESLLEQARATPRRTGWALTLPLGTALYLRDRVRLARGERS